MSVNDMEIRNRNENVEGNIENNARMQTAKMDDIDDSVSLSNFKVLYILTQLSGITLIVLMGSWILIHLGGFAGTSNPSVEFNWHPFLMTIGLIFLYGNAILIYRGLRHTRKKTLKYTHASIHMAAFILVILGGKASFDSHNLKVPPIPNMYSLHSWLGGAAIFMFLCQYIGGFIAYLYPGAKENFKIALMPFHIYFGLFGFVLSIASALTGLTEKAFFSMPNGIYSSLPTSGLMVNIMGVLMVVFGALVMYLSTEPKFKRRPIPEDAVLLTGVNE
ncbi:plasma membrane ascorbate-dependent reductase CYBRD1 isoform X1 [Episyrphus balteatus]|uniref:plasma membrane ascorbate-dependent reductase CYBRD1 isoform X1 n=2 Tax=Episyrphus balteatus TaxID=286459 RepID=UPI00248651F6|nr:plasma membrane ascorbate-dependent reductase CYBRD1 isoform X1 [Episyrphus balteatus]